MDIGQNVSPEQQLLHDLATPLTNLALDLESWRQQKSTQSHVWPPLDVESACQQMDQIMTLLRPYSRDAVYLERQIFAPVDIVRQVINDYRKPYRVQCQYHHLDDFNLPCLFGSPQDFALIVTHLLNNAAESYHDIRVGREIDIFLLPLMRSLILLIADNGQGMEQAPLYRLRHTSKNVKTLSRKHKVLPSGQGVYRVRSLLQEKFDAQLDYVSRPNGGTMAIAIFPVA